MEQLENKAADQDAHELGVERSRERDGPGMGKAAAARWRAVLKEKLEIVVLMVTILGTGVGTAVGTARWMKTEITQVKHDLEADIAQVKHDLEADIAQVRHDLKADIAQVRHDLEADIAQAKHDLEDKIADLATGTDWRIETSSGNLQQQIVGLREQMNGMQQQINALQEQVTLIALRLPARDSGGAPGRGAQE